MARKSRLLRLSEAATLVETFETANMGDDYRARFARDMVSRLECAKGMSAKQRNWLDTLIDEGVPAPKGNPVLTARIEAAQAVVGMREYDINILSEFLGKIIRGWDLSEKQTKWMEGILTEADRLVLDGPYTPNAETLEKLELCVALSPGYGGGYWDTHSGTHKAILAVK